MDTKNSNPKFTGKYRRFLYTFLFGAYFAYYFRYFWVIPDEFFQLNVQKAATFAFMSEMVLLVPFMFVCAFTYGVAKAVPISFALSFSVTILAFTIALIFHEWRERKGAEND